MIEIKQKLKEFVNYENSLLDDGQFLDWYDLFSNDGVYWIPGSSSQTDAVGQMSIALENKLLLKLRIERLNHQRAFSLQPKVRGMRVIQMAQVKTDKVNDRGCFIVETNVMYSEFQNPDLKIFPAKVTYQIRPKEKAGKLLKSVWIY